jgi:hypothetical protein
MAFYTTAEVARLIGVSEFTLRRRCGMSPDYVPEHSIHNRVYLFPVEATHRWLSLRDAERAALGAGPEQKWLSCDRPYAGKGQRAIRARMSA